MRKKSLEPLSHGSPSQTDRPTNAEVGWLRGLIASSGIFLVAAAVLVAHQVHVSRMVAAHLAAGGADDPDAVFHRGHILILPLVILPMALAFAGMLVCGMGWFAKRLGRRRSTRQQLR